MFDLNEFGDGPGGPMVSGKWINKRTGETIFIRDSIIDGDKMILVSNKGNIDFDSFSKNYIQASDEVYNENGQVIKTEEAKVNDIVAVEDNNYKFDNDYQENDFLSSPKVENNSIKNFDLIDKIFKKTESRPKANLKIEWADFPKQELSMLVNYFDVKIDDIATYIGKYLINEDFLQEALSNFLNTKMKEIK